MEDVEPNANFYSTLHTSWTPQDIATVVGRIATNSRKCGWDEWELEFPFGWLYIESQRPVLMHGRVNNIADNVDMLLAPLRLAAIRYKAEAYDDNQVLLHEYEWSPA